MYVLLQAVSDWLADTPSFFLSLSLYHSSVLSVAPRPLQLRLLRPTQHSCQERTGVAVRAMDLELSLLLADLISGESGREKERKNGWLCDLSSHSAGWTTGKRKEEKNNHTIAHKKKSVNQKHHHKQPSTAPLLSTAPTEPARNRNGEGLTHRWNPRRRSGV